MSLLTLILVLIGTYFTFGAIERESYFNAMKGKKSISQVTETYSARTATECAVHCGKKAGCFTVNFKRPDCELLDETTGSRFQLADDLDWKFMCKYSYTFALI